MYMLIYANNIDTLTLRVNSFIKLGWKCQGGLAMSDGLYIQAMVKGE